MTKKNQTNYPKFVYPIDGEYRIPLNKSGKVVLVLPEGAERVRVVLPDRTMMSFVDWTINAVYEFKNNSDAILVIPQPKQIEGPIQVVEL